VIGRKNWLFANAPRGAKASAVIYSMVETAKEKRLKLPAHVCHVFETLPKPAPALYVGGVCLTL